MPTGRYPKAEWKGNGISGGSYTSGPFKVVLHTTETVGLPAYGGGASAPHLTYLPVGRKFIQHTDFNTASRSLRNQSGGVQTNRDSVLQLEIVCYSNKSLATRTGALWVGNLSSVHLADIREFLEWTFIEFGVRDEWPGKQAFSYSEANAPGFRMKAGEWDSFGGVCAHQHVPENTHWDTGALDWATLMGDEDVKEVVEGIQLGLLEGGFNPGPIDGIWGPKTQGAFAAMCTAAARTSGPVTVETVEVVRSIS